MDIMNFNLRRSEVIKMGNTRSKVGFLFFLSLHHLNNRLQNCSLLFKSVAKKTLFR
jgi:hypothetical protein